MARNRTDPLAAQTIEPGRLCDRKDSGATIAQWGASQRPRCGRVGCRYAWGSILSAISAGLVAAHTPSADLQTVVTTLQHGGNVVVMRHAASPTQRPAGAQADPGNGTLERQLDERGQATAKAMGAALQRLRIPIGDVWTSPTFRAWQTAELAGLRPIHTDDQLGESGQSMQAATDPQAAWLLAKVAVRPTTANTFIVTQQPNIARAFPQAADVSAGECLVSRPDGHGSATLIGRIKIDDWPRLGR